MGTAVLRAHDCLESRFPMVTFPTSPAMPGSKPAGKSRSGRRKRSTLGFAQKQDGDFRERSLTKKSPAKNLVMERVTILKRGEVLESLEKSSKDGRFQKGEKAKAAEINGVLVICSTDRLGPEPETVPKLADLKSGDVSGMYAGSAFSSSPPPSSLPFPAFFKKKDFGEADLATQNLRRILRLDH